MSIEFPVHKLEVLEEFISKARLLDPILPGHELDCLLEATINLCEKNLDKESLACQRFLNDVLLRCFQKILNDKAVDTYKPNIHQNINRHCHRLLDIITLNLDKDYTSLFELLALVFNPNNRFQTHNAEKISKKLSSSNLSKETFAVCPEDADRKRGWLVDYINVFGDLKGFKIICDRVNNKENLTVEFISKILEPFKLCNEFLTVETIDKYLMPIMTIALETLHQLNDQELSNENICVAVKNIINSAKLLLIPSKGETVYSLVKFLLKMILKYFSKPTFDNKMQALDQIQEIITLIQSSPNLVNEKKETLTIRKVADWIKSKEILEILLKHDLYKTEYVIKIEKIFKLIIEEKVITYNDLNLLWETQIGKSKIIVNNIHTLISQIVFDLNPEQFEELFDCIKSSWKIVNKLERVSFFKLFEKLNKQDISGFITSKILKLFWDLAHSEELPTKLKNEALSYQVLILKKYSFVDDHDKKLTWIDKLIEEMKSNDRWMVPALRLLRKIISLFEPNSSYDQTATTNTNRHVIITSLLDSNVISIVVKSLVNYIKHVRELVNDETIIDLNEYSPDNWFNHTVQIQERLNFLRFFLKNGELYLEKNEATKIWQCLVENPVTLLDRKLGFKWFFKIMGNNPDLDPVIHKEFFENNILKLKPKLLSKSGVKCFERFFKAVNIKKYKLDNYEESTPDNHCNLIGVEYLWEIVTTCPEEIANYGNRILKELKEEYHLENLFAGFHKNYIISCIKKLNLHCNTLTSLKNEKQGKNEKKEKKLFHALRLLEEYISE